MENLDQATMVILWVVLQVLDLNLDLIDTI